MAEQSGSGGGATPWLALLVGGLLVVVAVIGYFVWSGQAASPAKAIDVTVTAPQLPDAPKLPEVPKPQPGN